MRMLREIIMKVPRDHIFTLVDVGSMGGVEAKWDNFGDDIKVIGFEPDEREFSKLISSPNRSFLNFALSNKSEDLKLYISCEPGKTSTYRPNIKELNSFPRAKRFETVNEVLIPASRVRRMDNILHEHEVFDVDFLKMDTQGSELQILKGSEDYLQGSILGVKVEVEFLEIYKGQPLFADVDSYMRVNGYQLMDLKRTYWKRNDHTSFIGKGQLVFGDALYFKTSEVFFDMLKNTDVSYAQSKTIKFIAACLVYGMRDYAVLLINQACIHGYIPKQLGAKLKQRIKTNDSQLWHLFFHGYLCFRSFLSIAKRRLFPGPLYRGRVSDSCLGNPLSHH